MEWKKIYSYPACFLILFFAATTNSYAQDTTLSCFNDSDCADPFQYCAKAPSDCSGQGLCEPKPEQCIMVYDPVCGCDGNTYGNDCEAAAAGVNVAYTGECKITNTCLDNNDCQATEYCAKVASNCTGDGVCKQRPELCPLVYDPVCGCDGNTYGNDCEAAVAGVNVAYKGECTNITPCSTNADCTGATEYCAKEAGACDSRGACETMPEYCITLYDPVCGCDGNTYGNDCEAAQAGVNVATAGECYTCTPVADNEKGPRCADGLDNDCDGMSDCNDPDCSRNKACK